MRSFTRTVEKELGLDRWPMLRDDYFGSYTRVVWLAQEPDAELHALAQEAADRLGLPLTVVETGTSGLERALEDLIAWGEWFRFSPILAGARGRCSHPLVPRWVTQPPEGTLSD